MQNQSVKAFLSPKPNYSCQGIMTAPDLSKVHVLTELDRERTLAFLNERPVHTVVMTSFINDNGLESSLNRGKFFEYAAADGTIEGVALIGHTTLVEARSDAALKALAYAARNSATPLHLVMSSGKGAEKFWNFLTAGSRAPRLTCTEKLFELSFPLPVQAFTEALRQATRDELLQVAEAQGEIAFMECGKNPMDTDREGFLGRVSRRIDQGRVFVVVEDGMLVFKADIIAESADVAYLEGIYVAPESRGKGIGSSYLAELSIRLLDRVRNVCLLSNIEFTEAHKTYNRAGFRDTDECVTIFA